MTGTTYAHAERLASDPFVSRPPGAELAILDAEIVAINGVPVAPEPRRSVVLDESEPHWLNPRYNPEPYLIAAKWLLIAAVPVVLAWGLLMVLETVATAVSAHAVGIEQTAGGIGLSWLLVALIGTGGVACAGLHCAGCRR